MHSHDLRLTGSLVGIWRPADAMMRWCMSLKPRKTHRSNSATRRSSASKISNAISVSAIGRVPNPKHRWSRMTIKRHDPLTALHYTPWCRYLEFKFFSARLPNAGRVTAERSLLGLRKRCCACPPISGSPSLEEQLENERWNMARLSCLRRFLIVHQS